MFANISSRRDLSQILIVGLIASLLVLVSPFTQESKADYTSVAAGAITINDRVCNLGDPNDHSTSATAFEITNSDQLWELTDCVSSSATIYFKLGNDIDVSDPAGTVSTASPIGFSTSNVIYSFSGELDGQNHEVNGISMSTTSAGVGLFAWLAGASVSNLAIAGSFSTSSTTGNDWESAGALAVRGTGAISLVSVSNTANVTGGQNVGGLLGYVGGSLTITTSHNVGAITGTSNRVGGFAGWVDDADVYIQGSSNRGNLFGAGYVGGFLGLATPKIEISDSFNEGNVTGTHSPVGGLVGSAQNLTVQRSYNQGNIQAKSNLGGLAGFVGGTTLVELSQNLGNVTATEAGYAGGQIGRAFNVVEIFSSSNTGNVSSPGNEVGGLIGQGESLFISYSYNVGSVSASQNVGGLAGKFNSSAQLEQVYSTGLVTGASGLDGLLGGPGTPVVTAAYTSEPSSHGSVKSIAQMKIAPTYVGFSFPSVWAFGTCSENNGFPVLVAFGSLANYFSYSCGSNTAPTLGSQSGSNPVDTSPAPSYVGPVIESPRATAQAGSSLQLTGEKLDSVTSVEIGGVLVEVIARDATSITIELPASIEPGTYDLVISSGFGKLTVMGAVVISAAVPKASELGELLGFSWTGAFTGNSRSLNQIQVTTIESALEKQPTATTVICWGYTTASSPNAWAIAHATQRAQAACKLVAQLNSEVKTAVRLRYGVKKSYAMRASLQFWELKPAP